MHFRSEGLKIHDAVAALTRGEIVIYPTETLYALGANPCDPKAVERVRRIKKRSPEKALPVVLGHPNHLSMICEISPEVEEMLLPLARAFWPGPLTILLPALDAVRETVAAADGTVAVRLTANSLARELAKLANMPLVATSANFSGQPAPARIYDLDPELVELADGVIVEGPWPHGGAASTIVRLLGPGRITMLRRGAISPAALNSAGFEVV